MFSIFRKIGWYIKIHWIRYTIAIICLNLASIVSVIPPKILESGIDQIINKTMTKKSLTINIIYVVNYSRWIYCFIYLVLFIIWSGTRLEYTIRKNFFSHLLKMDAKFL